MIYTNFQAMKINVKKFKMLGVLVEKKKNSQVGVEWHNRKGFTLLSFDHKCNSEHASVIPDWESKRAILAMCSGWEGYILCPCVNHSNTSQSWAFVSLWKWQRADAEFVVLLRGALWAAI